MTPRDRRAAVLASTIFNGIDFIEIANEQQTQLNVHFLNDVVVKGTLVSPPVIMVARRSAASPCCRSPTATGGSTRNTSC